MIAKPSPEQVEKCQSEWNTLEKYVAQESSLKKLFTETHLHNVEMDDVLIKVAALNNFYSTNIFWPVKVSRHIVSLGIDQRLQDNSLTLVNEIASISIDNEPHNFYAFATKYCSHHFPEVYPIYDTFVRKTLMHFKRVYKFHKFTEKDLKHYPTYCGILKEFCARYGLEKYSPKEIDRYLWITGKHHLAGLRIGNGGGGS